MLAPMPSSMTMANPFLGRGLVHPFRRDKKQDFAFAEGEELVRSAVGQVLGTASASDFTDGELPWDPVSTAAGVGSHADVAVDYEVARPSGRAPS